MWMSWDNLAIALAIAAILMRSWDADRAAGVAALTSYACSLAARWRAGRRAERADRELAAAGPAAGPAR
jgi:hypothetical protein